MTYEEAVQNIGKRVNVSDGSVRPPENHKKKVREWEYNNFSGKLTEVHPPSKYRLNPAASILTKDSPIVQVTISGVSLEKISLADV